MDCSWGLTENALLEALSKLPKPDLPGFDPNFYAEREAVMLQRLDLAKQKLYSGEVWTNLKQLLGQLQIEEIYYTPLPLLESQSWLNRGEALDGLSLQIGSGGEFSSLILFWLAAWAKPRPENLSFKIKALAWGKLKKELVLPVAWGTTSSETITVLETAVDDQNPQIWGYLLPKLLQEGAIDVYLTAIQMKKNRPGQLLTVLVRENQVDKIAALILRETTTLGLRVREERRIVLPRSFVELDTPWGKIRIKRSWTSFGVKWQPEYEDCRKIAEEQNWPLLQVYLEVDRLIAQKSEFWE